MADTFISYSRKDSPFVRGIFDALEATGRDAWIDWEGIASAAPDFLAEIYAGIESADTFLLIMTPDSLKSEICNLEIAHALTHHKRIVPVLHIDVTESGKLTGEVVREWYGSTWEDTARKNWETLSHINWLFFRENDDFDSAFRDLIKTLDTDLDYVRFHTRLTTRAREWEIQQRSDDFVLRGDDLTTAEGWLAISAHKDPSPTPLHQGYIKASVAVRERELAEAREQQSRELELQKAAAQRLRYLLGAAVLFLIVAVGLSVFAFEQQNNAQTEARNAENALMTSAANAATATNALGISEQRGTLVAEQAATSEAISRELQRQQSLLLAGMAHDENDARNYETALLIALEALNNHPATSPVVSRNELLRALTALPLEVSRQYHNAPVLNAVWNADETRILTLSNSRSNCEANCVHEVRVSDTYTGTLLVTLQHEDWVRGAAWNHNEMQILTWSSDGTARVWDAENGDELLNMPHDPNVAVRGAAWNADESRVLTWSSDGTTRVWDADTGAQEISFRHQATVQGAVWNADESRIMTWGSNGITRVWDVTTEEELLVLENEPFEFDSGVRGAVWNADETRILTWSFDGTARVWDAENGDRLVTLQHSRTVFNGFTFDPVGAVWNADETRILTWSFDGTARVWDAENGDELLNLEQTDFVLGAAWNADESCILTWAERGTLHVWDALNGDELLSLEVTSDIEDAVGGAAWNADASRIMAWSRADAIRIWQLSDAGDGTLTSEEVLAVQHDPSDFGIQGAVWNVDESRILTWAGDATARVWNVSPKSELFALPHPGESVREAWAAWNADETQLLTWANNSRVSVWDASSGDQLFRLHNKGAVQSATWNSDYSLILTMNNTIIDCETECMYEAKASIWDARTGIELYSLQHENLIWGAAWNVDETLILTWSADGTARVWDASNGNELSLVQYEPREYGVISALWNSEGTRFFTIPYGRGVVDVWDTRTGTKLYSLQHREFITSAAWNVDATHILTHTPNTANVWALPETASSPNFIRGPLATLRFPGLMNSEWSADGTRILTWSRDGTVRVWDAENGSVFFTLGHEPTNTNSVNVAMGATWSANESLILTWSADGTARVWDAQNRDQLLTLRHEGPVRSAVWNADESKILTWSSDGIVYIWDAETGDLEVSLPHPVAVTSAAWNADETHILTGADDGYIRIWELEFESYLARAQTIRNATRRLSNTERAEFFLPTSTPAP